MPTTVCNSDWTPEKVKRFWDWHATAPGESVPYFSAFAGDGIVSLITFLKLPVNRYLDYGCGGGHLLRQFLANSQESWGADSSPDSIARVNAEFSGNSNWRQCVDSARLPSSLPANYFDLVTCMEVIEHLDDETLSVTLDELARVTRQCGYLIVSTPCAEDLTAAMCYCPFCDRVFHRWQHVQSFTPEALKAMLEQRGMEVVFCRGIDIVFLSSTHTPLKPRKSPWSWGKLLVAKLCDNLLRPPPMRSFTATQILRPGPNLIAIARKSKSC